MLSRVRTEALDGILWSGLYQRSHILVRSETHPGDMLVRARPDARWHTRNTTRVRSEVHSADLFTGLHSFTEHMYNFGFNPHLHRENISISTHSHNRKFLIVCKLYICTIYSLHVQRLSLLAPTFRWFMLASPKVLAFCLTFKSVWIVVIDTPRSPEHM
jgi:hypothetical protein